MEQLIELACELRGYDYFRSEDPIEAARFVVSDATALLWSRVQSQLGFSEFAQRAAPQLVRWESRYGWTRYGVGRTREKETSLASVLGRMLSERACVSKLIALEWFFSKHMLQVGLDKERTDQ